MAKATIKRSQIESATITFNADELHTMLAVFASIGGDQIKSPRKHIKSIRHAIESAYGQSLYQYTANLKENDLIDYDNKSTGAIYFKNYKDDAVTD